MQLNLAFTLLPEPEDSPWAQIDERLREAAVERRAQLMVKAVVAQTQAQEETSDE